MPGWTGDSGGVDWQLTLDRAVLLPGRLCEGSVRLVAGRAIEARALVVTLRGEERWQYETSYVDSHGMRHTQRHTGSADLPPEAIRIDGAVSLAAGESREYPFRLAGTDLGPPSVDAEMVSVAWAVEAKLDIEGGLDSAIEAPVRVAQPVALLRAGVLDLGGQALFGSTGVASGPVSGTIELDPVPLGAGSPFTGRIVLASSEPVRVRAVRAGLLVHVEATVSGGLKETITAWSADVAGEGTLAAETAFAIEGALPGSLPPTCDTAHGRVRAELVVRLDRPWAIDTVLRRDVAVASTLEE